jgi:hypothetical protein
VSYLDLLTGEQLFLGLILCGIFLWWFHTWFVIVMERLEREDDEREKGGRG